MSSTTQSTVGDTDFELMVGDLRRSFIGWLKKTESETTTKKETLRNDRTSLEDEKSATWKQFLMEKEVFDKKVLVSC